MIGKGDSITAPGDVEVLYGARNTIIWAINGRRVTAQHPRLPFAIGVGK
jgi:hypothetical protein